MITGANAGLGFETALELARSGAQVVMACRSPERAEKARAELLARVTGATATVLPLDVSEPDSIRTFADAFSERFGRLDVLIPLAQVPCESRDVLFVPVRRVAQLPAHSEECDRGSDPRLGQPWRGGAAEEPSTEWLIARLIEEDLVVPFRRDEYVNEPRDDFQEFHEGRKLMSVGRAAYLFDRRDPDLPRSNYPIGRLPGRTPAPNTSAGRAPSPR